MTADKGSQRVNEPITQNSDSTQETQTEKPSRQELQEKAEWLAKQIDRAIGHARRNKRRNRRRATLIKITTIAFAGSATILLGLRIAGYEEYFKEIAFVLTALITVLNSLEPFFNFRALWVEHEEAQAEFHRLKGRLEFSIAGVGAEHLSKETLYQVNEEYQNIWKDLSETWIRYRREGQKPGT